jgi:TonB family protein
MIFNPQTMKTSSLLALWCGLVFGSAAFGETSADRSGSFDSEWQSTKLIETSRPTFPNRLAQVGVTRGKARVAVSVNDNGKLRDALLVGCTEPEFGASAVEAVRQWQFIPARLRGEPVGTTFDVDFTFSESGVVVIMSGLDQYPSYMRTVFGTNSFRAYTLRDLDRSLTRLATVAPAYPKEFATQGIKGVVTIDFYIDETGAVRMPCASREDDLRLSSLAIGAMRQWKFEPPTSGGKPVLVRVKQSFNFTG